MDPAALRRMCGRRPRPSISKRLMRQGMFARQPNCHTLRPRSGGGTLDSMWKTTFHETPRLAECFVVLSTPAIMNSLVDESWVLPSAGFTIAFRPSGVAFPFPEGQEQCEPAKLLRRQHSICSRANWSE